jgi:hypothetical protein
MESGNRRLASRGIAIFLRVVHTRIIESRKMPPLVKIIHLFLHLPAAHRL